MSRQTSPLRNLTNQSRSQRSSSTTVHPSSPTGVPITLQYGDQNNFNKYRKQIQSYAYQHYGYLGNIFTPGTTAYYFPQQPMRPSETELLALPDEAARDTAIDIYREEVKMWVREKGTLVKNQVPLFDVIYASISDTSQVKVKEAANWTQIHYCCGLVLLSPMPMELIPP